MPQMAPMNWILLFTLFVSLFLITKSTLYFTSQAPSSFSNGLTQVGLSSIDYNPSYSLSWKW